MNLKCWRRLPVMLTVGVMLTVLAGLVGGCGSDKQAATQPPLVKTVVVGTASTNGDGSFGGTIRNRNETSLAFQVGGRVIAKNVTIGDMVQAGQVLATLNQSDMANQITNAQGAVTAAQSQYDLAATNVNRYRQLYAQQAISQLQLDQAENAYKVAAAQLQQAQASLSTSQNQYGYTQLVAPSDGIITAWTLEVGQVVAAGQSVGSMAVGDEPEAVIALPEQLLGSVTVGTPASITFWALPGVTVQGTVREITPVPDPVARTYTVKIALQNPPATVRLGMTASVSFTGAKASQVSIPLTALVGPNDAARTNGKDGNSTATSDTMNQGVVHPVTGQGDGQPNKGGKAQVFVVRDGKVHLVTITTGSFGNDSITVIDGLKVGDRVVTAGTDKLTDGEAVRT